MNDEIKKIIIDTLKGRAKTQGSRYSLEQQCEFLVGAMTMYMALKPESVNDGSWIPVDWMFGIMDGTDFTEEVIE